MLRIQGDQNQLREDSLKKTSGLKNVITLIQKNIKIIKSNLNRYIIVYLSPFIILILITLLQIWANNNFLWQNLNPQIKQIQSIPKCYGQNCITLAYSINGNPHPYINHTLQYIKEKNNLTNNDIQYWNISLKQVMNKLQQYPNKTQSVVFFCTDGFWQYQDFKIPCNGQKYHLNTYTIIFNLTLFHRVPFFSNLKGAYPKDMATIKLKKDIDQGIISYYNKQAKINITTSDFPSKNSRFITNFSIFAQYGSFFVMIPYLILMVMEGANKLKQKQDRLRIGLNIVGVSHFQYYCSQFLTYLMHVILISINFCIGGEILNIKFWSNGLISFNLILLILNGFTIGIVSFCIVASVSQKNLGMSIMYGFVLYSIVMQWLFSGGYILQLLYLDTATITIKLIKFLFNLYPSFHFTKIFADISRTADNHFDTLQNRYVQGRIFNFDDLFYRRSQTFSKPIQRSYTLPNSLQSLLYMFTICSIYMIILFLLDRFVQSNRGYKQGFCLNKNKRKNSQYINQDQPQAPLVQIKNLQKKYKNGVHALRGVTQQLKKGQIVGLLGQNGAGKSTLINILVGVLSHSHGNIIVDGININQGIQKIRKIIGVCPQFDILWEQLTAYEHIKLFCNLKAIKFTQQYIQKSLDSVSLLNNKDGKVKTFSGGMRRRLSLAISLLGNPKLIVLDEPTTGMDPKIRIQTWKIILKMRNQNRTMLITTHNMQQAQCLSDRILIMSKGRIIAKGTLVQLKRQFGQGYKIQGLNQNGDKIQINCTESQLQNQIQKIKQMDLKNWQIHQTTLQQVFLRASNYY